MTRVFMIECELGWGQKVDEIKEFPNEEEARAFCIEYNNKHNSEPETPDWYIYAKLENQKEYGMLR